MNILITNGRVIDPHSGFDQSADVAIAGGKIVSIGAAPAGFQAERWLDATGCIV
ncbi:MAG TPA: dihydroorotase, partial [Variovorax sp.]|nr:dihydroorotase [Variovorax sp.]